MESLSFFISEAGDCPDDWKQMLTLFGSVEEIERVFGIEFACAIEEGQPVFLSDDEALLLRYDGCVEKAFFRYSETKKTLDTRIGLFRFDIAVDESARGKTASQFHNAKIVRQKL